METSADHGAHLFCAMTAQTARCPHRFAFPVNVLSEPVSLSMRPRTVKRALIIFTPLASSTLSMLCQR
eukprot:1574203-Heterocapsa_arctica.AAC.1